MKKICYLVDSSSGIKSKQYKNVYVLPLLINVINKLNETKTYKDNVDISCKKICEHITKGDDVKTSQASPGQIIQFINSIYEKYDKIFCIPIPISISNNYNSWNLVSKNYPKLHIIKNIDVAYAVKWIINDLFELEKKNKDLTIEIVEKYFHERQNKSLCMLTVSNVNQLKKGGRLNEFAASAIKLLNLKIIIFLDNKGLYLFKCCKTIDKAIKSVFKHFKKENDNFDPVNSIKRIAILKSPTFTLTKEINDSINDLKKICKNKTNFYVDEIPGIICAHTGAESFALYFELY